MVSLYTQTLINVLPFFISNSTAWTSANNLETDNFTLIWSNGSAVELSSGVNFTELVCGYISDSAEFNTSLCNISRSYICSMQGTLFLYILFYLQFDFCIYNLVVLIPSSGPGNLSVSVVNTTSVLISWIPPPCPSLSQQQQQQDQQITGYTLTYYGVELDRDEATRVFSSTTQSVVITGLEEATNYKIELSASTSAGTGPKSYSKVYTPETGNLKFHLQFGGVLSFLCSSKRRGAEFDSCRGNKQRADNLLGTSCCFSPER